MSPTIGDIATYLAAQGWQRESTPWRGASIWSNTDGYEILVPPRDDLSDTELRISEILAVLVEVEQRTADEIVTDINAPFVDVQCYHTSSEQFPGGFTSLPVGLRSLQCAREAVGAAGRAVVDGPLPVFPGSTPPSVAELMRHARLGPSRPGSYSFSVGIPLDRQSRVDTDRSPARQADEPPLGRQVTRRLYESTAAARAATNHATEDDPTPFEEAVLVGVSANLCDAMSGLAGQNRQQPFAIAFRWGRGVASELPPATVRFPAEAGKILKAASAYLRRVDVVGRAGVTGRVESLHDQPERGDRWRAKVRGALTTSRARRSGATVWLRMGSQRSYDRTIAAHRTGRRVRAEGALSTANGRLELVIDDENLEILD